MLDKIDSFMLCSQVDLSTANQLQSTISFGRALEYQKISSTKETEVSQKIESLTDLSVLNQKKPSLIEIFNDFLNDPLSTYTLQLCSSGETEHCMVSKTVNEKYGKYTTSIERQQFHHQLQIQDTLVYSQPSETPRVKFTKISSILRMIEQQKNSQKLSSINKANPKVQESAGCSQINIEDMQSVSLDKKPHEKDTQTDKLQSQVFLGLESNMSSKCQPLAQKICLANRKSENISNKKELLSPVPQNPQKKIFKIKNSNEKPLPNPQNFKGIISGLEFSKKLRKKKFNHKSPCKQISISPFKIDC